MSFDFGSVDFEAGDIASDIDVDPGSADYGAETLADSSDQVGDFAGNSDFVDSTDPSSIDSTTTTEFSGYQDEAAQLADGNGVAQPSAIDSLKDSAASAADKVKNAASGAFDKIKAEASSTLTKLESQFSAKNIEAFATKTAKSLITQVESTAINLAKQTANKALSTVVGPAVASTLTNSVTRSLTGPTTNSATAVKSSVDPNSPNFVGSPAPSNTSPASPATDEYPPGGFTTDSKGNTFKTLPDGTSSLVRAAEVPEDVSADTPGLVTSSPADVPASSVDKSASNVGYVTGQDPENGTYYVKNETTGEIVATGLTEQAATLKAQDQTFIDAGDSPDTANAGSTAVRSFAPGAIPDPNLATVPASTDPIAAAAAAATAAVAAATRNAANTALSTAAGAAQGLIRQAQNQQTARLQNQNKAQAGDWRVRLSLAPTSNYLYNASDCGPLLWPLYNTNGVIFPYTPTIDTSYKANYAPYDLTHSNYRGYFYQNSYVDGINIKATFTAQDTAEANYLLAVIHFFRSVTKMFYGQDAERGSPPPLVFLSGLGDFQFNQHPCVVSQFNYNLPSDVNYIRAQNVANNGTNQLTARNRQTTLGNPVSNAIQRLSSLGQGIRPGALSAPFAPQGSLAAANPTYVPTKMDISINLLPVQSRSQVSQLFSLKGFANGNLLKGGFW